MAGSVLAIISSSVSTSAPLAAIAAAMEGGTANHFVPGHFAKNCPVDPMPLVGPALQSGLAMH